MRIFATLFLFCFSILASATSLNKIVVFGDSLSDNGNLYAYMKHQLPVSPPYFEGRFSNGPVWVEALVKAYYPQDSSAHLLDYAYGGAGVLEEDDEGVFTLSSEVNSYFLSHDDKVDDKALYVVWIGSNNYLAMPEDTEESLHQVEVGIRHQLERLAQKGAKQIMVVNLPDFGATPAAEEYNMVELMTYFTENHNKRLSNNFNQLKAQYPNTHWIFFDINTALREVIKDPAPYGFSNVKDTCYELILPEEPSSTLVLKMAASAKKKGFSHAVDPCEGYLFFDPVHPSAKAHELLAERTKELLKNENIEFE